MANGGSVIFKFEGDTKDLDKATKKTESALGTLAKSFTIAQVASNALSKAISVISSNLEGAISRYDTMNNFPKVMKSLGFQTEQAEKAVSELSDGLLGLPTALDESISLVQRLTASNGDLNKSTKIYLAMNNAILAGGASAQVQASAMEQLTQAYSKGKFDAVEYRSVMSAMPGQLKQVATYLGYTSTALGGDMQEALKDGSLSMDKFMNAFIELNEKGSNGMASFAEQAKNATGGISTSFKNSRTAIVREITKVITKINESLQQYGGISGVLSKGTDIITDAISKLGDAIKIVLDNLPTIIENLDKMSPLIGSIVAGLTAFKATLIAIQAIGFISKIGGTFIAFMQLLPAIKSVKDAMLLLNMTFAVNSIVLTIGAIAALIAGFVLLWNKCEGFRNFWINLWENIKNFFITAWEAIKTFFTETIPNWFNNFIETVKEIITHIPYYIGYVIGLIIGKIVQFGLDLWNFVTTTIPEVIGNIIEWFKLLPGRIWEWLSTTIPKIVQWGKDMAQKGKEGAVNLFHNIINTIKELPSKMLEIGKNIVQGIWNGIVNAKNWIVNKVKEFARGILDGIKNALGIHSPSTVFRDVIGKNMALGIGVGFEKGMDGVEKDINKTMKDFVPSLDMGNMFDLSPTLSNTTTSSSNVNVTVYNNMETDFMGNLVNNIKTFSNGSKNDYNYGMA